MDFAITGNAKELRTLNVMIDSLGVCKKAIDHDRLTQDQGIALLAALVLVASVGVMGATVLMATSTEISISGNYRRTVQAFYLAEAGIEEARARLKIYEGASPGFIRDPSTKGFDAWWSAYIIGSTDWTYEDDRTYSKRYTNYFPTGNSQTNSTIVPNSLQSKLSYWVKIQHKREYEAERNGHRSTSPHYVDGDEILKRHTRANPGEIIYYGYPSELSGIPTEFTTAFPTESFPVEIITAYGRLKGGSSVIEVEAIRPPTPKHLAAMYASLIAANVKGR